VVVSEPRPVVLTGGRSARFGRDKLREPVRDGWLVDVAIAAAREACGAPVTLVGACDPAVASRADAHLDDDHPGQGPAGGVLTALERLGDVVILSGDLRRIGAAAVRALLHAARGTEAQVVRARGEPLIAVYRRTIAPMLAERLREGRRSLFDLAARPHLLELDLPGDLADADTPEALAMWSFEEIDPRALDLVPIAARRALDRAGRHLSLAGWRTLALDARGALVTLGGADAVDVAEVIAIAARAKIAPRVMESAPDPDGALPADVPLGAERARVERAWSRLRRLERFAVVHVARSAERRGDPARLVLALEQIIGTD